MLFPISTRTIKGLVDMDIGLQLFDSHCHLYDKSFTADIDTVFDRAREAGVSDIMIVGIDAETSRQAAAMAASRPGCYAAVGFHPHDAAACTTDLVDGLAKMARDNPHVRAWGEIGLDFNRMYSPRDDQERWFIHQLAVADRIGLPVIFHERDSRGRFLELLAQHHKQPGNGVVHCFSGTRKELMAYLERGYYIGITGIVTLKERGRSLRQLVGMIPEDRILIETDAPYLTPAPAKNRTRRNEPSYVRLVLERLAGLMNRPARELASRIRANTCRLFRIPAAD
jgi:TatD DNase family protein